MEVEVFKGGDLPWKEADGEGETPHGVEDVDPESREMNGFREVNGMPGPEHLELSFIEKIVDEPVDFLVGPDEVRFGPDRAVMAKHDGIPAGNVNVGKFGLDGQTDEVFEFLHCLSPQKECFSWYPWRKIII